MLLTHVYLDDIRVIDRLSDPAQRIEGSDLHLTQKLLRLSQSICSFGGYIGPHVIAPTFRGSSKVIRRICRIVREQHALASAVRRYRGSGARIQDDARIGLSDRHKEFVRAYL